MDIIFVRDLKVDCVIGVWEWERKIRQTLHIDLDLGTDISKSAASDNLDDTLDYKAVTTSVREFVAASEFNLVETLAEKIAMLVLDQYKVPWIRVSINKRGALRHAQDVGVIIERGTRTD
jgi:dihydroneopterin aldolase